MNRSIKIIASIFGIAAALRFAWIVQLEGSQGALEERFPHIDPKIVREIHLEMTREGLQGKYANIKCTDEAMDAIFHEKYAKRITK